MKQSSEDQITRERAKLESRTWFLRLSLSFNVAVVAGLIVRFTQC